MKSRGLMTAIVGLLGNSALPAFGEGGRLPSPRSYRGNTPSAGAKKRAHRKTQADYDRMAAAEEKRARKNAKRLTDGRD